MFKCVFVLFYYAYFYVINTREKTMVFVVINNMLS